MNALDGSVYEAGRQAIQAAVLGALGRVVYNAVTGPVHGPVHEAVHWAVCGAVSMDADGPIRVDTIDLLRSMGGLREACVRVHTS